MIIEKFYIEFLKLLFRDKHGCDRYIVRYLSHRMFTAKYHSTKFQDYFYNTMERYRLTKSKKEFNDLIEILKRETGHSIERTNEEIAQILKDKNKIDNLLS